MTVLNHEYVAMRSLVDDARDHTVPGRGAGREFCVGSMPTSGSGEHCVALCQTIGPGNNAASIAAARMLEAFPSIQYVLMIGIAGGVPSPEKVETHVRLGDIVVSGRSGVVKYDFVKDAGSFEARHPPRPPSAVLLETLQKLRRGELTGHRPWEKYLAQLLSQLSWSRPPAMSDVLHDPDSPAVVVAHPADPDRQASVPRIFEGTIGAADVLLKNAARRELLRRQHNVRAIEMEGSGIADAAWTFEQGYLVIRGICDYCDAAKGDDWQRYAAAAAAAYARALVEALGGITDRTVVRFDDEAAAAEVRAGNVREATRARAADLLGSAPPPKVEALFEAVSLDAVAALDELTATSRTVHLHKDTGAGSISLAVALKQPGRHCIVGAGGSGKTRALYRYATDAVRRGEHAPVYIPLALHSSADAVIEFIQDSFQMPLREFLADPETVLLLDDWSRWEHERTDEARRLMHLLARKQVVLLARRPPMEISCRTWTLDPLAVATVRSTIERAFGASHVISDNLLDLLRVPLVLVLYVLTGKPAATAGELLRNVHKYLADRVGADDELLAVLARVAATLAVQGEHRSRRAFDRELGVARADFKSAQARRQVDRYGALTMYSDTIVPFHDLYWEWLVGVGLPRLSGAALSTAIRDLGLRHGLALAMESDVKVSDAHYDVLCDVDISLAVQLLPYAERVGTGPSPEVHVAGRLRAMLADSSPTVRARAISAASRTSDPDLWGAALDCVTDDTASAYPRDDWARFFAHASLWEMRGRCSTVFHTPLLSDLLVSLVSGSGDSRWLLWLRAEASPVLSDGQRLQAALGILDDIPDWLAPILESVVAGDRQGYRLRPACRRRTNLDLAKWVSANYDSLALGKDSVFLELNGVLVTCGNESVFEGLLDRFPFMDREIQRLLSYAIAGRGEPWVSRFLERSQTDVEHLDRLLDSPGWRVSEVRARSWIRGSHWQSQLAGWRALGQLRGDDIADEIRVSLPKSFDQVDLAPALAAVPMLTAAGKPMLDELWRRFDGTIQPKLAEQFIEAVGGIKPLGMASLVAMVRRAPSGFPVYHLSVLVRELLKWQEEHGLIIRAKEGDADVSFAEWIVLRTLHERPADSLVGRLCRSLRGFDPSPDVLDSWVAGSKEADILIGHLETIGRFHRAAFEHAIRSTRGNEQVVTLVGAALADAPASLLLELLERVRGDRIALTKLVTQARGSLPREGEFFMAKLIDAISAHLPDTGLSREVSELLATLGPVSVRRLLRDADVRANHLDYVVRLAERSMEHVVLSESLAVP